MRLTTQIWNGEEFFGRFLKYREYFEICYFSLGDRQRDSGVLLGNNSATCRARAEVVQQGSTHPEDGLVHPRALPERKIYIHGARRTCDSAFYHIQEGKKASRNVMLFSFFFFFFSKNIFGILLATQLRHSSIGLRFK